MPLAKSDLMTLTENPTRKWFPLYKFRTIRLRGFHAALFTPSLGFGRCRSSFRSIIVEHSRPVRLKTKQRKDNHETQNVPASFLNGFKISDIDKLILALILRFGVIGLRNWTQSLAVSLPGIKTLIKRLFLLVFLYELSMSF